MLLTAVKKKNRFPGMPPAAHILPEKERRKKRKKERKKEIDVRPGMI